MKTHNRNTAERQKKPNRKPGPGSPAKPPLIHLPKPSVKEGILVSFILLCIAFLLYYRTVDYGYVLDDQIVITENIYTTRGIQGIPDLMTRESFEGYFKEKKILVEGGRYRPLSMVTFAMEWSLFAKEKKDNNGQTVKDARGVPQFSGNPHVSHFINILLYALTGILVFYLLYILFKPGEGKWRLWNIPFVGALIFILHPVHIEAVANIKGRDEIMAMLFALTALYFSLRYVFAMDLYHKSICLLLSGLFFFLGLLSKENAVTFLLVIPLTIYFFTPAKPSANFRAVLPALAATFLYAVIRIDAVGLTGGGGEITDLINNPFYGMPFGDRYATVFYTLLLYLKLLFFPHPLTTDYWPYHVPWMHWSDLWPFVSLGVYLLLAVFAWRGWKKKTVVSYCILFFIITLSVASNIFFSIGSFMNERFIYMSSLAFCILIAYFIIKLLPVYAGSVQGRFNVTGVILMAAISAGFIVKTWQRIPDWKDDQTINISAVMVSKNSARANCFMGVSLFATEYMPWVRAVNDRSKDTAYRVTHADTVRMRALLDSVYTYLNNSVKIYPSYDAALITKSGVVAELYKLGVFDAGRLLDEYDTLIRTGIEMPFILEFIKYLNGQAIMQSMINDPKTRELALQNAERLKEFHTAAYHFYSALPDRQKSLEYIQLAAQIAPNDTAILSALSRERQRSSRLTPAIPGK
jgi:hypothetical protein